MSSNGPVELDKIDFCNEIRESEIEFDQKVPSTNEESLQQERELAQERREAIEDDRRLDEHMRTSPDCRTDRFEREYLLKYAEKDDLERVRKCLDAFPDSIRAVDKDGYTPLHRACHNSDTELVKLLIRRGSKMEAQTAEGWRPIHCAAYWGNLKVMHLLICYGANINARTVGNNTCLHFAAQRDDRRLLECLVYNPNIDLTVKNNQGDTAYMIAKRNHPNYQLWHNVPLHTPLRELDLS